MELNSENQSQSYSVMLFKAVREYGDKPAIIVAESGIVWTFSQLISAIERMSSALKKLGLKAPDVVSLVMVSSVEVLLAQFAVLATGATVTFGKPVFTEFELSQHFIDCKPRFIFTTAELADKILRVSEKVGGSCGEKVFVVDEPMPTSPRVEGLASQLKDDSSAACLFDETVVQDGKRHVAYLPYSSGTTGPPKGVMCSHSSFCYLLSRAKRKNMSQEISGLQMPLFHISGICIAGLTLYEGHTSILMPNFEARKFLTIISKYKVSHVTLAAYMVMALVNFPECSEFQLNHLKVVFCIGAHISVDMEKRFRKILDECGAADAEFLTVYGLTEAIAMACLLPPKNLRLPHKSGSAGVALPDCEVQIVVSGQQDAVLTGAPREVGEIWVRHPGMMLGYLNLPEVTHEILTPDGWLKTGDLGYLDEDRYLFVVGRRKELFHCNGNQVSPAEIEGILLSHEGVKDAAVIGVPHKDKGEVALAFIVRRNKQVSEEDLKHFIASQLSAHKHLHGGVRFVDNIPRNALGKLLRHELNIYQNEII